MNGLHVTQTDYQRVTPVDDASLYSAIGDYSITPLSFTSNGSNTMTIGAFKAVIAGRLVELESDFNVTLPSNLYGVLMYYTWDLSKVNTIDEATGVVTDNQNAIKQFPLNNTTIPQDTVNPSASKGQRLIGGYINSSALSMPASWGSDYISTIRPYRETHQYSADYLIAGNNTVRCTRIGNVASMSINAGKLGTTITSPTTKLFDIPDLDMHPTVNPVVSPASFGYQWWSTDIRVQPAYMGSTSVQPACVVVGYAFSIKGTQGTSNPIPAGHNFVWGVSYAVKPPIDALSATLGFSQDSTIVDQDIYVYVENLLTGTGNHTVTGTNVYGYLSNETDGDLLTLFKGLEGQTVTVSVDYEYSGFIAGSDRNRIGWETHMFADSSPYFSAWHYPNNDSGSGRISTTFVVPKNITSAGSCFGYVAFSGSGIGTLSHLKLEKGTTATPWTPAPEDVI